MAYPNNVLHLPTESSNKQHSAVFPKELPAWFIKLFTQPGDVVLDPYLGSGTTCVSAVELGRNSIGIEIKKEYYDLAKSRVAELFATIRTRSPIVTNAQLNLSGIV